MRINEKTLLIYGVNHAVLIRKLITNRINLMLVNKVSSTCLMIKIPYQSFSNCKKILNQYGYRYDLSHATKIWIGCAIGAVVSLFLMIILSQFCWQVEVNGCNSELKHRVQEVLEQNLHCTGQKWDNIDFLYLNDEIQKQCDTGIVSFGRYGCTLVVNFSEYVPPIELKQTNTMGVFATADGIVSRIFVESGTPLVKAGDTVHVGQMLIAPYIVIDENEVAAEAKGRISLFVWHSSTVEFKEKSKVYARTGQKCGSLEEVWHDRIISTSGKNTFEHFEVEVRKRKLFTLPVTLIYTTFYELDLVEVNEKFEDEKDALIFQAREKVLTIVNESDIMEEKVTIEKVDGTFFVTYYVKTEIEV